jgi:hypothetical protein
MQKWLLYTYEENSPGESKPAAFSQLPASASALWDDDPHPYELRFDLRGKLAAQAQGRDPVAVPNWGRVFASAKLDVMTAWSLHLRDGSHFSRDACCAGGAPTAD